MLIHWQGLVVLKTNFSTRELSATPPRRLLIVPKVQDVTGNVRKAASGKVQELSRRPSSASGSAENDAIY